METGAISREDRARTVIPRDMRRSFRFLWPTEAKIPYIMDTPGFSSLSVNFMKHGNTVFRNFSSMSRIAGSGGVSHISEPDCGVKEALAEGKISKIRYDDYVEIYQEVQNRRKY